MAHSAGSNLGPYRIIEPVGRGGMASVYKAYEPSLDRYVALKVLPPEFLHDPTFAERFRREAQTVARLEHPQIIPIFAYDIDAATGTPWMAMRLISGGSLSQRIKRGRLAPSECARILKDVGDALDYAHGAGVIHRDVKPQNVLLDDAGRVYLADFGIAKMVESSAHMTQTGMIAGTPQYMAPEQALGRSIGKAIDIYALGIVAFELFTGRVPFSADTPVAVLMKQANEPMPLPPPSEVKEDVTRAILRATAKDPAARWPSASAFAGAVTRAVTAVEPIAATSAMPALGEGSSRRTIGPGATVTARERVNRPAQPGPEPTRFVRQGGPTKGLTAAILVLALVAASTAVIRYRSRSAQGAVAAAHALAAAETPGGDGQAIPESVPAPQDGPVTPGGEGSAPGTAMTPEAVAAIEDSATAPEAAAPGLPDPVSTAPHRAVLGQGPMSPKERIEAMVAARRARGLPVPGNQASVSGERAATSLQAARTRIHLEVEASWPSTGPRVNGLVGEIFIDNHPYRRFTIRFDGGGSKTQNIVLDSVPLSAREIKVAVRTSSGRRDERMTASKLLSLSGEQTDLKVAVRVYSRVDKSIQFR